MRPAIEVVRSVLDQWFELVWEQPDPAVQTAAVIEADRAGRLLDGREWSEFPA